MTENSRLVELGPLLDRSQTLQSTFHKRINMMRISYLKIFFSIRIHIIILTHISSTEKDHHRYKKVKEHFFIIPWIFLLLDIQIIRSVQEFGE